jgi:polyisoprenoid-binding protein YceI
MKTSTLSLLLASFGLLLAPSAHADKWEADPAHSHVGFSVRHMMISNVKGEFGDYTVTVQGDPKDVTKAALEVVIKTASINTRSEARDKHLKSPDFFDVAKYPSIKFKSKKIRKAGDGLEVLGSLTIRNVSKDVTLKVASVTAPAKDPWGMTRLGAEANLVISRKDFGLKWNKALEAGGVLVGDEVKIAIEIELVKKAKAEAKK